MASSAAEPPAPPAPHACACGRSFQKACHLARHAKACSNSLTTDTATHVACEMCGSRVNNRRALYRHRRACQIPVEIPIQSRPTRASGSAAGPTRSSGAPEGERHTNHYTHIGCVTNNQYVTTNHHNNIHITVVRPFTQEDVDAVKSLPYFNAHMTSILREAANNTVARVVELKHFNPDVPQNKNLRKRNRRDQFAEVFDGTTWKLSMMDELAVLVANGVRDLMDEFMTSNPDKVPPAVRDFLLMNFFPASNARELHKMTDHTGMSVVAVLAKGAEMRKRISQSLAVLLYNNRR